MTKFVGLRTKTYNYLTDYDSEAKKVKGTKKCAINRKLTFESYKNCFEETQFENKRNYLPETVTLKVLKNIKKNL